MLTPLPQELHDADKFVVIEQIDHDDALPVIRRALMKPSPIKNFYFLANIVVFGLCGWLLALPGRAFLDKFSHLGLGFFFGYILLFPLHENIHALTYRYYGGKNIKVIYNWRSLTAFCVADGFVVDSAQMVWLCLMPFLIINSILVISIVVSEPLRLILMAMLLLHVGACSGDFGLVNLVWANRRKKLWTYDDIALKRTFFFAPLQRKN